MTNERKVFLSAAFCGLWALVIWYYAGARTEAKGAHGEVHAIPEAEAGHLMDEAAGPRYPGVMRDLFTAQDDDARGRALHQAAAGGEDAQIVLMRQRFRFIGYIGRGDERLAFVSDGEEVFAAKKGALISEGFRVSEISDDALAVEAVQGSGLVWLGLDGGGPPQ